MASSVQVQNFISTLSKLAQAEASKRKLAGKKWSLPSVCIAQAALETGWGESSLMIRANAYFGIKATGCSGKVYSTATQECYDGSTYTTINDCFRAYDSLADSVKDYFDLITTASFYSAACCVNDAYSCINAIKNGGYATDPTYVEKIMSIINGYNLTQYDKVVTGGNSASNQPLKSIDVVANEVINGQWGSGDTRKAALTTAGYDYNAVQRKVNKLLNVTTESTKTNTPTKPALKSINVIAKEVIAGKWGVGDARKTALTKAGYDYNAVQRKVNELSKSAATSKPALKSINVIAKEVIAGKWGSGDARKAALTKAGYNYAAVQNRVNALLKTNKKSINVIAKEVIAGKWGVGAARKTSLTKAGYDYNAVQKKVNELLNK